MRFSGAAANSASAASLLQYRMLVDVGVTSTILYVCNGNQYLTASMTNMHAANTYSPVGALGGIDPIEDESDFTHRTVRLWLAAINSSNLFEPLREDMFNRPVVIRHAYLDPNSDLLVSTPELLWKGFINKVEVRFNDPEKGNFYEIECETALRKKAQAVNFNKETLQTVLGQSGDTFFNFIHQVPTMKALWGNQSTSFNGVAPGHWTNHGLPGHGGTRTWTPGG